MLHIQELPKLLWNSSAYYCVHKSPPLVHSIISLQDLSKYYPRTEMLAVVARFLLDLLPIFYMHSFSHPFVLYALIASYYNQLNLQVLNKLPVHTSKDKHSKREILKFRGRETYVYVLFSDEVIGTEFHLN